MAWPAPQFPLAPGEDLEELKLEFAALWAAKQHSRRIGYHLFPGNDNVQRAWAAQNWYTDPTVIDEMERLQLSDSSVGSLLPSKEEVALEVLNLARQSRALEPDEAIKAYKLYAEIAGLIDRGTNLNIDNRTQQIFVVPAEQTIEEFEGEFREQQVRLLEDARKRPT